MTLTRIREIQLAVVVAVNACNLHHGGDETRRGEGKEEAVTRPAPSAPPVRPLLPLNFLYRAGKKHSQSSLSL